MVELTLVRHGQAQSGARDEASYDKLSDLGQQQAGLLGDHFARMGQGFDHVFCGSLHRQQGTAARIGAALDLPVTVDARLNEMDYFGLSESLRESHALDMPTDRDTFIAHCAQVFAVWKQGEIHSHLESFDAFETRISEMIALAEGLGGRVLMVTSGGVIGMAMRLMMGLEVDMLANVLLQVQNTSVHRYVKAGERLVLDTFNAVPHLERPDFAGLRSYH